MLTETNFNPRFRLRPNPLGPQLSLAYFFKPAHPLFRLVELMALGSEVSRS